ncbi:MAG TPA: glyoxalase [Cytophagales bacterium]|nr:glyoxalase [Cytophagales bacterium]HAP58314.1 glyoxalase [Cytophagales bacterium]
MSAYRIPGLHHVTATVNDAQEDYDFYTKLLGLRLVKKTVNFDNNRVYHFYYGNEAGEPSTIMTTFPYKGEGVREGVRGTGQVMITAFSVPMASFGYWKERLSAANVTFTETPRFGDAIIDFQDPSGLELSLVGRDDDDRGPWVKSEVPEEHAIRGFFNVTLSIAEIAPTFQFLTDVMGFTQIATEGNLTRFRAAETGPGNWIDVRNDAGAERGHNGLGTVHHVAFRIESNEEQAALRERILGIDNMRVTEFKDRKYFRSIYFRIPGGVLFEVATVAPGFPVDEGLEYLGQELKLPDWEEPKRAEIEKHLPKVIW